MKVEELYEYEEEKMELDGITFHILGGPSSSPPPSVQVNIRIEFPESWIWTNIDIIGSVYSFIFETNPFVFFLN